MDTIIKEVLLATILAEADLRKISNKALSKHIMENNDFISKNLITEHITMYYTFVSAVFEPMGHARYLGEQRMTRYLNKAIYE
jgi:hypothetical protein